MVLRLCIHAYALRFTQEWLYSVDAYVIPIYYIGVDYCYG